MRESPCFLTVEGFDEIPADSPSELVVFAESIRVRVVVAAVCFAAQQNVPAVSAVRMHWSDSIEQVVCFVREQTDEPKSAQVADAAEAAARLVLGLASVLSVHGWPKLPMSGVVLFPMPGTFEKQPLLFARIAVAHDFFPQNAHEPQTQPPRM